MAGFTLIALVFAYLFIASKHSETTTNEHESIKTVEPRSAIPENNPSQVSMGDQLAPEYAKTKKVF